MSSVEDQIRQLGENRDIEGLQDYISRLNVDDLLELITAKLRHASFTTTWKYILQGFTDMPSYHRNRFKIVQTVLKEIEDNSTSIPHTNEMIQQLCIELVKFKTEHLVKLCEFCVELIQSPGISQMTWKELLPELLNVIIERNLVEHNDIEMTGLEYKHELINSLCAMQWSPHVVTSLTSMFNDSPLTKEEHEQVVNKLGQYIEKMTPQEIPSFAYQLLKLAKYSSGRSVFLRLQNYFGVRVYEQASNQSESSSDNTDLDVIEKSSDQEAVQAESTLLFHIHSAASIGHDSINSYFLSLKNLLRSPEFVLHPFQLSVLFTISTISHYKEKVFEIVRSCISRTYAEELKKKSSAWFREMVPATNSVESVFSQIILLSSQDRELVLQGLVNFAFVLLNVGSQLGRDPIAEKQWQLGNMILFKIIKRKRHTAPVIIETLGNNIITGHSVSQYIECMYMMSKSLPLLMLENKSIIITIMEGLIQMPVTNANQLLDALVPLTKVSPTIRDHFILLLRKALYSKLTDTRQMAVTGFLKMLTNLKISNLAALSQCTFTGSFSSGHSLFTQISVTRASQCAPSAFSNEALCLEVLSILRRCFMQQAEVRTQLYEGLYDAVCMNPDVGVAVLEVISLHFNEFYNIDKTVLPPLKFDKITITKDVNVVLQEPLAKLVYAIGLISNKVASIDKDNGTVIKLTNFMESMCERMINCELVHFELDDGTDLLDIMPESQQKLFVLKEAMSVYEALIGYKFFSWTPKSENCGQQISGLFQGYCRLKHFSKSLSKPKKAESKKRKADPNTTTQQSNNTTIQKDGAQKPLKYFKLPGTVLDLQVMVKILNLLHEPMVTWSSSAQANVVKTNKEFHQHAMNAALQLITSVKGKKTLQVQTLKIIYGHLCEIATTLYERIIKRMAEFLDFDVTTAVVAAESLLLILNLMSSNQFESNFKSFLSKVGGKPKEEELESHLSEFVETYQKLVELDDEESCDDPETKKLHLHVVNTLHFLLNHIPTTSNPLALQMTEWLKRRALNNTIKSKLVATGFISLLFDAQIKFKVSLTFFEHVAIRIGDITGIINEEENEVEEFQIITEQNVPNVLLSLCNSIKMILEEIDWIIARLRAEYNMITYPGEENIERRKEYLKSKERGVCCQLCFIVTILTHLSNCTVPPGNLTEAVLKNLTLLYCTLSSLTKYFVLRSSKVNPVFQGARFDRLVRLAGKQLTPVVYKQILHIEESQKQPVSPSKKKQADSSSLKNKVLKETRLIPKVVYEIEQFRKSVFQLSHKTKIDLDKFMGQGTVRDFRILHLKEVLEKATDGVPVTQATQESDSSMLVDDNEDYSSDEEASLPATKKSKC